ncbi:hypothetical protein, partial [Parasutterella excrementihominis]|uniref:hypothetical protein n=1 Tax=Parasutterella excrementihominis TaxID=487175 RepID=UPI003C6DE38C
ATAQLQNNLNQRASDQTMAQVGNLFGDLANAYLYSNAAKQLAAQNQSLRNVYAQNGGLGVSDTHSSYGGA